MKYLLLLATAVIACLFLFWKDVEEILPGKDAGFAGDEKKQKAPTTHINIIEKWDLPDKLLEVSGIAYLDPDRFAAVQDEDGILYIYNRTLNKIEKEIAFSGRGDYEGLAVDGDTAYIVTASGSIYQVNMKPGPVDVKEFTTSLTAENNVEGLCFDAANKRLLLTVKDKDPMSKDYKGIYAFDLNKKQFIPDPVYKIVLNDEVFRQVKKSKTIMPSAIGIHPQTGEMFITDGPGSNLLVMESSGRASRFIQLGSEFAQPEGITFSPSGDIFISNEGNKKPGNIIQVRLSE